MKRGAFIAATAAVACLPAVAPAAQFAPVAQQPVYLELTTYRLAVIDDGWGAGLGYRAEKIAVFNIAGKTKEWIAETIRLCQSVHPIKPDAVGRAPLRARVYSPTGIKIELPTNADVIDMYASDYEAIDAKWKACQPGRTADDMRLRVSTSIDGAEAFPDMYVFDDRNERYV